MSGPAGAGTVGSLELMTDLLGVADELYGLPPGQFTAARNEHAKRARADGDRDLAARIQQLRKPSLAAWVVNTLVRREGREIGQLLDLGVSLREAQAHLDGTALRELTRQRRTVTAAMTAKGRRLAAELGERVSDPVARQVEDTLHAAMVDTGAASAVRSGLLTDSLTPTGLGTLDPSDAVADGTALGRTTTPSGAAAPPAAAGRADLSVVPEPEPSDEERSEAARRARAEAEATVEDARDAADRAQARADKAARRVEKLAARGLQLQARMEELRREVAELEHRQETLDDDLEVAEDKRDRAQRRHRKAVAALETALADLGQLDG